MRLSQLEFGRIFGCSPTVVSRWERGLQRPPADGLIRMGKMVARSSGWYFWKLAGVRQSDALRMLQLS
jgi:transcriptional regulator with XRE-family HTH domain